MPDNAALWPSGTLIEDTDATLLQGLRVHISLDLQQAEAGGTVELETRHTGRAVNKRYCVVTEH